MQLTSEQEHALQRFATALLDQEAAQIVVHPSRSEDGFWFGGGNLVRDGDAVWLCGRFRNAGDSRTGVEAGARGLSCEVFRAEADTMEFEPAVSWSKEDLGGDAAVLSIEGTALHRLPDGSWELFVSTEKGEPYPEPWSAYQKQGTGVWSIDRIRGSSPERLDPSTRTTVLRGRAPDALHVKDPVVFDRESRMQMVFSAHPISWASSNTGSATRLDRGADLTVDAWQLVERGAVWDVAATRITDLLQIPRVGRFADTPAVELVFYDGAESMRRLEESARGNQRARGWSCEEIGGAMWAEAGDPSSAKRLSRAEAWFTSPYGTGASRYVKTLATDAGIYATWQQAQDDGSQPLVMHFLSHERAEELLS